MNGVIALNKPAGLTSHDCVFKIRKILKTKKVGHTGTLDPEVTGVLPICIGEATKLIPYLTDDRKKYIGEITLGFSTTTEDAHGEIVEQKNVDRVITREEILTVLNQLTGDIQQTPPMYSAVKVNGKKLYEYARAGIEVERPTRTITIFEMMLLDNREVFEGDTISFKFEVFCSKGTYIRTLAVQMGELLGYPAHMSYLTRTKAGAFTIDDCVTLEELEEATEAATLDRVMLTMEQALNEYPRLNVTAEEEVRVFNGGFFPNTMNCKEEEYIAVYNENNKIIAMYTPNPKNNQVIKPTRVFHNQ
ncbi:MULTISPECIES: tRNA pseudouridine(55) synthase TruB [unclassified Bacillus (in: firmicutes)]|uniref:tRNA pseudouridine(55) synthase TruB n=1 Tax=unclassified Bacillus (in: firmicutes) TaxID=185979 RepID=UPI000BF1DE62|nr:MULTISPECIES: tRNA pseudouridine(55) synthase TruB [unclassified Bacillus (in: firmicutes)]PEJ60212.1 tRNA pseudouridine(55) synthase TruB [Bacillus sp. AFS002410]PEL10773.1 tRNA pseudouridine(55) synthase TruB [Bacillus sp. AFS017336]